MRFPTLDCLVARIALAVLASVLLAGCGSASRDDVSTGGRPEVAVQRAPEAEAVSVPLDVTGDVQVAAAGGRAVVTALVGGAVRGAMFSVDTGGWTTLPDAAAPEPVIVQRPVESGPRDVGLVTITCPSAEVNAEGGCAPGSAALRTQVLDGRSWAGAETVGPLDDLATSQLDVTVSGSAGGGQGALLTYPTDAGGSRVLVMGAARGGAATPVGVAGAVTSVCASTGGWLVTTVSASGASAGARSAGGNVEPESSEPASERTTWKVDRRGAAAVIARGGTGLGFCSPDGRHGEVDDRGRVVLDGQVSSPVVTGDTRFAAQGAGATGVIGVRAGERTTVAGAWGSGAGVRSFSTSVEGTLSSAVAATDDSDLYLVLGTVDDPLSRHQRLTLRRFFA